MEEARRRWQRRKRKLSQQETPDRSKRRKSRDPHAMGSREVMVVIKVGIVVTVAVVVNE